MLTGYDIDIFNLIEGQLTPKVMARGWKFGIETDPYYLRTKVTFWMEKEDTRARMRLLRVRPVRYQTLLEYKVIDGRHIACKLPDWFVSHLCTVPYHEESIREDNEEADQGNPR